MSPAGGGTAERPSRTLIARAWRRTRRRRRYTLAALVVLALAAALAAGLALHGTRQGSSHAPRKAAALARHQAIARAAIAREAAAEAHQQAIAGEAAVEARRQAIARAAIAREAAAEAAVLSRRVRAARPRP